MNAYIIKNKNYYLFTELNPHTLGQTISWQKHIIYASFYESEQDAKGDLDRYGGELKRVTIEEE